MIQTTIARILGPTRVVLAAGTDHGVKEGMEFILYELSDTILDPETKESLGQLELHKGRVRVIHVQEKLSTATTLPRKVYKPSFADLIISSLPQTAYPGSWVDEREQLRVEGATATAVQPDLTVRVGDLAHSVS